MKRFFFDTANINFIKNTWHELQGKVPPQLVDGITTNPNAFFKINKLSLKEWLNLIPYLCETVSEIRGDNKGVVYVQGPSSKMTADETLRYADLVSSLGDGNTKVGLKIPPFKHILDLTSRLGGVIDINVTGIADCSTALKCITYPVRYVSIIPGRMEEVGIDAKNQISFINQSNLNKVEVIAGSMRTLEQLKWTFQYNTIPTIGERVWPLILEGNNLEDLININYKEILIESEFSPIIDKRNIDLSISFFEQMNNCGLEAFKDIKNIK